MPTQPLARRPLARRPPGRRPPPREPPPRPPPARLRAEAPTAPRRRLDVELVRRGLTATPEQARQVVERGEVRVAGAPATNAARMVASDEAVSVVAAPGRFVGRGGEKLAAAVDQFGVDLGGTRVLDAGSSTGGFTDCALQAGAASVVAVDVGRGQLHHRLATDVRVEVHDRTNVRHLRPGDLGALADVVVADLSFISLGAVVEPLLAMARPGATLVWLVKPQFEAGRHEATEARGVIADPQVWHRALASVCSTLVRRGAAIMGLMTSPLRGADGNVEFLLHALAPAAGWSQRMVSPERITELVTGAVAAAVGQAEDPLG